MSVYTDVTRLPSDHPRSAVAIGKFDGVHAGHRAVLAELISLAAVRGVRSAVVTFDRNPLALLRPEACPENLVEVDQKVELITEAGIDDVLVLTFDQTLADLPPREFVTSVLVDGLNAEAVLVGRDFRFGARGAGTVETLRELGDEFGFDTIVVPDVTDERGDRASSSAIRTLMAAGDVETAGRMLGRAPAVRARVVHGLKRGRELGYPTANLETDPDGFVPADGVYAGWLIDHDVEGRPRYPAAISIGSNPTFDDVVERQVEAHVIDADLDLYGHLVDVEFAARIRGMVAYEGIGPLIAQMGRDVDDARRIIAGDPGR